MKRCLIGLCLFLALLPLWAAAEGWVMPAVEAAVRPGQGRSNDAMFDDYIRTLFGLTPTVVPRGAGERLTGSDADYYRLLKAQIEEVAAGRRTDTIFTVSAADLGIAGKTWTAQELGVSAVAKNGAPTAEAAQAADALVRCDVSYMLDVLMADCPYSLYWFDKVQGVLSEGFIFSAQWVGGQYVLCLYNDPGNVMRFKFAVAAGYEAGAPEAEPNGSRYYHTDPTRVNAANAAVTRAGNIVAAHAGESDCGKLNSYRREICALTAYNEDAAAGSVSYGDPWQLVYVFDGDESTRVVCEGYSKAFQYLCEHSAFRQKIVCRSVTGKMGVSGRAGMLHMWNLVTMPDGLHYLCDVANCDSGAVGADDLLFLAGYSFDFPGVGYAVYCGSSLVSYEYDADMRRLYSAAELAIASARYVPGPDVPDPDALATLTLPAGLTALEDSALEGAAAQRIVVPEGVETIGARAFAACPHLIYIELPDSLRLIDGSAFAECPAETIFVRCGAALANSEPFTGSEQFYIIEGE